MHSVCLLLAATACFAAPARPEEPGVRAEAMLRQVAKMPPEQQRAWLLRLETRLIWAGRLSMKHDEAQKEEARLTALLRQKTVTWPALQELLRLLDQREKAAISRLVRQYRTQVYATFEKQPKTLVQRQEAWYRVWSAWEAAGSPAEQQDRLMDWLELAIRNSLPDSIRPLPGDPKFEGGDFKIEQRLAKPAPEKPREKPKPRPEENLAEKWRPLMPRGIAPAPQPFPDPRVSSQWLSRPPARVRLAHRPPPGAAEPWLAKDVPLPVLPPRLQSRGLSAERLQPPMLARTTLPWGLPPGILRVGPAGDWLTQTQPRADKAPVSGIEPREAGHPASALPRPRPAIEAADRRTVAPPRAVVPARQPEGAAPEHLVADTRQPPRHAWHDPLAMVPKTSVQAPMTEEPPTTEVEVQSPPGMATPTPAPEDQAQVNVEELATRIAAINLNLHTLEAELDEQRPWTADQLDAALSRLDILVLRQKDLALFRDLVAAKEQARLGRIEPPKQAIARLAARIVELRDRLRDGGSPGGEQQRQALLKHLDELSDRLAGLTAEK